MGSTFEKVVDKTVNTARSLQTVIDFGLNRHLNNNVNGKIVVCMERRTIPTRKVKWIVFG